MASRAKGGRMFDLIGRAMAQIYNIPGITPLPQGATFANFFSRIIIWVLYLGGAIAVIYLVYGGILYITAGGDPEAATKGKTAVVNAIIGIVIIALALVLAAWVSNAIGTNTPANV